MTLAPCRRCGTRPRFYPEINFWDKENGHWRFFLNYHPAIYCPKCGNEECGCTLNERYPEKYHYRFATVRQVIGQWNQRNQTCSTPRGARPRPEP